MPLNRLCESIRDGQRIADCSIINTPYPSRFCNQNFAFTLLTLATSWQQPMCKIFRRFICRYDDMNYWELPMRQVRQIRDMKSVVMEWCVLRFYFVCLVVFPVVERCPVSRPITLAQFLPVQNKTSHTAPSHYIPAGSRRNGFNINGLLHPLRWFPGAVSQCPW